MRTGYSYMRFSSEKQRKGGSIDRQTKRVNEYCEQHSITIDESLSFRDEGISALKGANVKTGRLGEFLLACENNMVDQNGVFLVDNLDRISRENFNDAGETLKRITTYLDVVTLSDGRVYKKGRMDVMDAIYIIFIMSRANEESLRKVDLISAAYETKRKKVMNGNHIMTTQIPFWLTLNKDKTGFDTVPDKIKIVTQVFELALSGLGTRRIANILNEQGLRTARGKLWGLSSMQLLIKNPAVIGHFQMKKGGVITDVKENYYPKVISADIYHQIQALRLSKRGKSSGPTGAGFANLFKGLLTCTCGYSMNYLAKGRDKRAKTLIAPARYLKCRQSLQSKLCDQKNYKYDLVENFLLKLLSFLDYSSMAGGEVSKLQVDLGKLQVELLPIGIEMKRLMKIVSSSDDEDIATIRYNELKKKSVVIMVSITNKEKSILKISADYVSGFDSLKLDTEEQRTKLNRFLLRHIETVIFDRNIVTVSFKNSDNTLKADINRSIHIEDLDGFNSNSTTYIGGEAFCYKVNLDPLGDFEFNVDSR